MSDADERQKNEQAAGRWQAVAAGMFPMERAFAGALGWDGEGNSHMARHEKFGQEKGLLCLDVKSGSLVKIVDWEKDEYWGERVLVVAGQAPWNERGLGWERRQSDLAELGAELQGHASKLALSQAGNEQSEGIAAWLAAAWSAMEQTRQLALVCQSKEGDDLPKPPRL